MPKKPICLMTQGEISGTEEYLSGARAFRNGLGQRSSTIPDRQRDLLFRIGWSDAEMDSRDAIPDLYANMATGFLDKRTRN